MELPAETPTRTKFDWLIGVAVGVAVALLLKLKGFGYLNHAILGCLVVFVISLLALNKRLLAFMVPFVVPLSVPFGIGGAAASLPAEPLLGILTLSFAVWAVARNGIDKQIIFHPISILLMADLLWMLVASVSSTHVEYSLKRVIMRSIFVGGAYLMMSHFFKDPKQIIRFFSLYAVAATLVALNIAWKHGHYDYNHHFIAFATKPFFSDHTIYSACITLVFLFISTIALTSRKLGLSRWVQVISWLMSAILLGSVFHASSRAAWLSLVVVGLFFVAIRTFKIGMIGVILSLFILGSTLYVLHDNILSKMERVDAISRDESMATHFESIGNIQTDNSNLERLNRWNCALRMFKEKPWLGWGPGTYQFEYHQFQTAEGMTWISTRHGDRGNAHSEYLTYLCETGFLGLLIFLGWVFYSIHLGLKLVYHHPTCAGRTVALALLLGLISFYVHGAVNAFIDQDKMAMLVFAALGGLVALEVNARQTPSQNHDSSPQSTEP